MNNSITYTTHKVKLLSESVIPIYTEPTTYECISLFTIFYPEYLHQEAMANFIEVRVMF